MLVPVSMMGSMLLVSTTLAANRYAWRHALKPTYGDRLRACRPFRLSARCSSGNAAVSKPVESAILSQEQSQRTSTYGSVPPPPSVDHPCWTDELFPRPINLKRQIFCNRSLNMRDIKSIGFDMDYTLAQYKPETFEALAHEQTVHKLVTRFGYPQELYRLPFDWTYMMRGLVIDKKRGNIVKIDRHKYVKVGYHGFRKLSRWERQEVYETCAVRDSFDEPDYAMIDTLFSLAEAHLFMRLVDMKDAQPNLLPPGKGYVELYRDVRAAVDLVHRDGSLKRAVAANPSNYIHKDERLVTMLRVLRDSGKKVFLATNSLWDYTHVVMNYLVSGAVGKAKTDEWLSLFDCVITGCGKPAFFGSKQSLFEVDVATSKLTNTDDGAPTVPIFEDDLPALQVGSSATPLEEVTSTSTKARVFQGGTFVDLHKMLGIRSGAEVLYVGDHIYGDILRSKKSLGWRTMLVVPELENELSLLAKHQDDFEELRLLRQQREQLDDQIALLEYRIGRCGMADEERGKLSELLEAVLQQAAAVKTAHGLRLEGHHTHFHPVWGRLLKTGYQNSRFAHQVERFACLYTSHVANLALYSPDKGFKAREDHMAHEDAFTVLNGIGREQPHS